MAQTQYRNMDKSCEGILPQGNDLHNSLKLRKGVAVYKTGKLIISNSYLKKVPEKKIEARKKVLTQKVAALNLFSLTNQLHILCF